MSNELYQKLIAAKASIDHPDKWCQGVLMDSSGRRCMIGATGTKALMSDGQVIAALAKAIQPQYDWAYGGCIVAEYNDSRTHAEVMRIFDIAIEAARPTTDAVKRIMAEALEPEKELIHEHG